MFGQWTEVAAFNELFIFRHKLVFYLVTSVSTYTSVTGENDGLGTFLLTSSNTWLREVTYGERPTIPKGIITLFYG